MDAREAFEAIIDRLRERFPEVAEQVVEEVERGRPIPEKTLTRQDRLERDRRMTEANVGKILKGDVTTEAYSGDEMVELALEAILRLSSSMTTSRMALLEFIQSHQLSAEILFGRLDDVVGTEISIYAEVDSSNEAHEVIDHSLRPVLNEVKGQT